MEGQNKPEEHEKLRISDIKTTVLELDPAVPQKYIYFKDCDTVELNIVGCSDILQLVILQCKITRIKIKDSRIKKIYIQSSVIEHLLVEGQMNLARRDDMEQSDQLLIDSLNVSDRCTINNIQVNNIGINAVWLRECVLTSIKFNRSWFHSVIWDQTLFDSALFHRTHGFSLSLGESKAENIKVEECDVQFVHFSHLILNTIDIRVSAKRVSIYKSVINEILIHDGKEENIFITGGEYTSVTLRSNRTENLSIRSEWDDSPKIHIGSLNFSSFNGKEMNTEIKEANIDEMNLSNYESNGRFEVVKVTFRQITINLGKLSNAHFHAVHFETMLLLDSIIRECKFTNIIWMRDHNLDVNTLELNKGTAIEKEHKFIRLADSYRQLKIACLNSNDKFNALEFYAKEMECVWQAAKHTFPRWYTLGNVLILGSDKLFSRFGQSLLVPLMWLFGIHFMLFALLLHHNEGLPIEFATDLRDMSWNAFWRGLSYYLNLLNPVHGTMVMGVDVSGTIDFFMRLSSGYFIFFFVRATRKFHISI